MGEKRSDQRIIRHITFSEGDDARIRQRAATICMPVASYIRREALDGIIKVYDTTTLYNHTMAVNEIANSIRECISRANNRILYESDIEQIEDAVSELLKTEQSLLSLIRQELMDN